ncbi:hypothetical protein O0L34_g15267 [Tuta absoluta]|nr:hypothetical protein O0L34_g15267 [Tuta absoluta]
MNLLLIILGAVTVASVWAEKYKTTRQEGVKRKLEHHKSFLIPSGHCSGYISKPNDYDCDPWQYDVVTLRVSADDIDAAPVIDFKSRLHEVFIYRKGSCYGDSHVKLDYSCSSVWLGAKEKDTFEAKDSFQPRIKVGDTGDKPNRRLLGLIPNHQP